MQELGAERLESVENVVLPERLQAPTLVLRDRLVDRSHHRDVELALLLCGLGEFPVLAVRDGKLFLFSVPLCERRRRRRGHSRLHGLHSERATREVDQQYEQQEHTTNVS